MVKALSRKYSDRTKEDAVEMYLAGPEGMREVAKALEVSLSSLNNWVQRHRANAPGGSR